MGDRRWVPVVLGVAMVGLCAWCSFLSGLGGWFLGGDIAGREARVQFAATATAQSNLPPLGVLVTRTDRSGPAARAGVLRGDVIIAVDGRDVQDVRDLRDMIGGQRVGARVRLLLSDGVGQREVLVELASSPEDPQRPYLGIYYTARAEEPADL
jgi:PDZ domain-containing secreted protein